jgi:glycosyltransferase involved in cell wall biosynthesis
LFLRNDFEISSYLKKRKIPLDKNIIFCFARADEYKGLDVALKAMLKISRKYGLHPVLIASKFSDEKFIENIQEQLKFIANKSQQPVSLFFDYEFELPKYLLQYKRVKYLLNMPKNDFCPLVPFEAEILGHRDLCVVNSNIACIRDVITDMQDGFLCLPASKHIVKKIAKIFDLSPDVRNTIIASGKARALKAMDIKKSYLATLKMLIDTNI